MISTTTATLARTAVVVDPFFFFFFVFFLWCCTSTRVGGSRSPCGLCRTLSLFYPLPHTSLHRFQCVLCLCFSLSHDGVDFFLWQKGRGRCDHTHRRLLSLTPPIALLVRDEGVGRGGGRGWGGRGRRRRRRKKCLQLSSPFISPLHRREPVMTMWMRWWRRRG